MSFKYDIAVSFAGEDRTIVEPFVMELRNRGVEIFYDRLEQSDLWGKNLVEHLYDIYSTKCKYCIVFVSEQYSKKKWTKHELRSAQSRALLQDTEYILPIRLDDTKLAGIPENIGYLDLRSQSIEEIVKFTLKKIGKEETSKKNNVLFWKIRSVINANDPADILVIGKSMPMMGPPSDEYDSEVSDIYDILDGMESIEKLTYAIREIFIKSFNEEIAGGIENYVQMAHEIWELRNGETFDKLYGYGIQKNRL